AVIEAREQQEIATLQRALYRVQHFPLDVGIRNMLAQMIDPQHCLVQRAEPLFARSRAGLVREMLASHAIPFESVAREAGCVISADQRKKMNVSPEAVSMGGDSSRSANKGARH